MTNIVRSISGRQTANPKTSLGFYGTIIIAIIVGDGTVCAGLARTPSASLIPGILIGSVLLIAGIIASVVYLNIKKPQNLMLGEITGQDYRAIEEIVNVGDSRQGERSVPISAVLQSNEPQKSSVAEGALRPARPPQRRRQLAKKPVQRGEGDVDGRD